MVHGGQANGFAALGTPLGPEWHGMLRREVTVARLDDFALSGIGFVKIDVEGHELEVLRGGGATIERERPTPMIEANGADRLAELTAMLAPLGDRVDSLFEGALRPAETWTADLMEGRLPYNEFIFRQRG